MSLKRKRKNEKKEERKFGCIQKSACMTIGKNKSITSNPLGVGRVEAQVVAEDGVGHGSAAQRSSGMPALGFGGQLDGQAAESGDGGDVVWGREGFGRCSHLYF